MVAETHWQHSVSIAVKCIPLNNLANLIENSSLSQVKSIHFLNYLTIYYDVSVGEFVRVKINVYINK